MEENSVTPTRLSAGLVPTRESVINFGTSRYRDTVLSQQTHVNRLLALLRVRPCCWTRATPAARDPYSHATERSKGQPIRI